MRKNYRRSSYLFAFFTGGMLLFSTPHIAEAAGWEYGAILDVGGIYTDNIFLDSDGMEESETVLSAAAELYLRNEGDRIAADLRYRPEAYFYDVNSDADNVYHVVDASLTTTLVRDRLFLLLAGSNYQSIVTPEGRIPTTNVPISLNRVDSQVFEVRPYWQQRIGPADLYMEVGMMDVSYDDELYQGSQITRSKFSLDNVMRQQGIAWGISYEQFHAEYDDGLEWEHQRAQGNIGYWVTGTFRIFGSGGGETDLSQSSDPNLDESFWEAGFQYVPSKRLNLEMAAGKRFFGTSFRANIAYTMRRGATTLTYSEVPSTGGVLSAGRRPIFDTDNLEGLLNRPGFTDQYLKRRFNWTTNIELAKSEFIVRLFHERRERRALLDGSTLEDQDYGGISARWNWRMGSRSTLILGVDSTRIDDEQRNSDLRRLSLAFAYQMSQRVSLRAEYANSNQDGRELDQFNYSESQYRLFLRFEL